jgi:hypothetical protein
MVTLRTQSHWVYLFFASSTDYNKQDAVIAVYAYGLFGKLSFEPQTEDLPTAETQPASRGFLHGSGSPDNVLPGEMYADSLASRRACSILQAKVQIEPNESAHTR